MRPGHLAPIVIVLLAGCGQRAAQSVRDARAEGDLPADSQTALDANDDTGPVPPGDAGGFDAGPLPPDIAGCADGTREGFADAGRWPRIAACSGAWSLPGLLDDDARTPHCDRAAGNDGTVPGGEDCSAADLCSAGWHLCAGADDVRTHSPTGCLGATPAETPRFFAAAQGASAAGTCSPVPDPASANNLHGCANIGDLDDISCVPLERILSFATCATTGVWHCGGSDEWLREAAVVTKDGPALGGVLCCSND